MFKKTFKPVGQRFKSFFKHSWPVRKCLKKLLNLWPNIPQTLKKSLKLWVGSVCSADRGGAREPRILYRARARARTRVRARACMRTCPHAPALAPAPAPALAVENGTETHTTHAALQGQGEIKAPGQIKARD